MSKAGKFEDLSNRVVDLVGGNDNVESFLHCMTRLRFNVRDINKVNAKEIEKINGVMGIQWSGKQLQIIIGQDVSDAYALIQKKSGLGDETSTSQAKSKRKFSITMIFDAISGCIIPILPILIAAGFIKLIASILLMTGLTSAESSINIILTFVGDAGFYFLPIFIGHAAAKKFGANPALGMMMGGVFLAPAFIETVTSGTALNIFGIPVLGVTYGNSVFPIILTVLLMAPIEKFIAKHSPSSLRVMLEPLLTILIMVPLALIILGPIGSILGNYLSEIMIWVYDTIGFVGVAIFAAIYPLVVMTGMHTAFLPYVVNTITTTGTESFFSPAAVIACVNQGVASLAVGLKSKNSQVKSTAITCSITALLSGIIEPAMYGVNIKYKTPMYASMAGSFIGAAIAGLGNATVYVTLGNTGLLSLPAFIGTPISGFIWMLIGVAIGFVVTFILTFILYKEPVEDTVFEISPPVEGDVIPLTQVEDQAFSEGLLGQGMAVLPTKGQVFAPFDGVVSTLFPTKHAIGLTADNGVEMLIHVGMNTVQLNGEGFTAHIQQGDRIKKGQLLLDFDMKFIQEKGFSIVTPIVITNSSELTAIEKTNQQTVNTQDNLLLVTV
ncbi:beta-glucoside-specific PTS transporter subunit IIABC [Listeria costaricensis]|uniref:beta-glucoside-specific PTS transporter subunit IIABC n=1 Tax=Listeria costaricensis TaxID=2026604 RepID=UPI000C07F961|nr:beta-glucoside-specific PTS transporter subunit IIABC [Listeria costaricensis]